jgi:hypothetical protein
MLWCVCFHVNVLLQSGGEQDLLRKHNREMKKVGFNADEPVFVASAIFQVDQMTPGNLDKIMTYSADLLGVGGYKVSARPLSFCLTRKCRSRCLVLDDKTGWILPHDMARSMTSGNIEMVFIIQHLHWSESSRW